LSSVYILQKKLFFQTVTKSIRFLNPTGSPQ